MALMRTKRNGGDDPIIVKTKRAAYVPNVENQSKIAKYEASLSKRASDIESYNRQMKAYSERQLKGERDIKTFFKGGGRYLSPKELEEWNKNGLIAEKVYVSKDYGKEQSSNSMNSTKGAYSGYKGAFHEWLVKPVLNNEPIEKPKLDIERVPLNKVVSISSKKRELVVPEKWEKPELRKIGNIERVFFTGKDVQKENKLISRAIENVKREIQFSNEMRQGEAYFGSYADQTAAEIKSNKKSIRSDIKDVLMTRPIKGVGLIKDAMSKLKTARQAERYVKNEKKRFATPEKFKNYKKK